MADRLVAVDDTNFLFPAPVQAAYLADVQSKITTAVANIPAVAQAVADKIAPLTTDGQVNVLLNTATATRNKLDARYLIQAPPPSGGDDTAMLQSLLTAATNTSGIGPGIVQLQDGTYHTTNTIKTASGFWQPSIRGRGFGSTTIQSSSTNPVIEYVGTPGSVTAGRISDLSVQGPTLSTTNPTGMGIRLTNCGGVKIDRVQYVYLQTGLMFYNLGTNGFTEFCVARDNAWSYVQSPIVYKVDGGNESFHGSGLIGNNVIGLLSTNSSAVTIGDNAFPYNSPLEATVFFTNNNQALIRSTANPNRPSSFYGKIRYEFQGATSITFCSGTSNVYLAGTVQGLAAGTSHLGNLYEVEKINYDGGNVWVHERPRSHVSQLGSSPTAVTTGPIHNSGTFLIAVTINGPSYLRVYTLNVWQSPFNSTGVITQLANPSNSDGNTVGPPTFTWGGYQLYISNANFSASFTAAVTITYLGGGTEIASALPQ